MKIEFSLLRSRVARRMFLLFVLCAMAPIVLLTVFTTRMLTSYFDEQAGVALRTTSKSAGMGLVGRLDRVDMDVRGLRALPGLGRTPASDPAMQRYFEQLSSRISGAAVVTRRSVEPLFGAELPAIALGLFDRAAGSTSSRLLQFGDDDERARFVIAMPITDVSGVGIPSEPDRFVMAEIDPDYLWSLDGNLELPWNVGLSVFADGGRLLHSSLDRTAGLSAAVEKHGRTLGTRREFEWTSTSGRQRGMAWTAFLEPQFGHPGWTVVVTEPAARPSQTLSWVSDTLPLVVLLCMAFVVMISLVQIRRSLVPVVELTEGTTRIAAGDFEVRVGVTSDDEFGQLADSFNTMAGRIGDQFNTLRTTAGIDRELLSTLDEGHIVSTLLRCAPDRFRCDGAALIMLDDDATGTVSIRHQVRDASGEQRAVFDSDDHERFVDCGIEPRLVPAADLPHWLAAIFGTNLGSGLLVPVRHDSIRGLLALGFSGGRVPTDEAWIEAQRLGKHAAVALSNATLLDKLENMNWETLYALARAVDANSPWTAGHSERVTSLALQLAARLGIEEADRAVLHRGGLLHDIGKIGVPREILEKPGKLTDEEYQAMRDHPKIGAEILAPISGFRRELPLVLHHHERFDGGGYPDGIAGDEIPFLARILSVADVFDALISDRPYRPGWARDDVVAYIREASGTQFDPQVVAVFVDLFQDSHSNRTGTEEMPCMLTGASGSTIARA